VAIVALSCCLAALAAVLLGQVCAEFQAMGQRDAPEADATTGLYFALNDMDAQVANVLLVGGDSALAASRSQDLATFASDRATANQDLQQATISEADLAAAVAYDTGTAPGQSDGAFNQYDAALASVIAINASAFTAAIAGGEDGAVGWEAGLPAAGLVLLVALTLAGVRPRLAEYQ
jgi:hypothetical protein